MSATPITDGSAAARPAGRLGAILFGVLVLASFAAFFLAQRLKHIPTAVQQLKLDAAFYPEGGGRPSSEPISFQIERPDEVTVRILDTKGATVATLASVHPLPAYKTYSLAWSGRYGAPGHWGAIAPRGEYRVQVLLSRRKVEVRSPSYLRLVRSP